MSPRQDARAPGTLGADAAASPGWRRMLAGAAPQLLRYATDPREGDALLLLPDVRPGRALFLGNALAIAPFLMADRFETVVVADRDASRLAFARRRQHEEDVANLACVPAEAVQDVARRDGGFDVVMLGEESPESPTCMPIAGPWAPLRLAPLLAAGGCLIYGVRFRLVDVLARSLTCTRRSPSFYPAHAARLWAAGLRPASVYWRRPDLRPYQAYIPLGGAAVGYWLAQAPLPRSPRERLNLALTTAAARAGLLHRLVDNFLVLARQP
jgi:hypothetical protein